MPTLAAHPRSIACASSISRRSFYYDEFRRSPVSLELETYLADTANDTPLWLTAVRAAESKKASDIRVLDLQQVTSFTDFFVICSGSNQRQIQAISDAVHEELARRGERPISVEGYQNAEWVLADYGDFIVHILSPSAREYYDLERLWRHARNVDIPQSPAA